MKALTRIRDAVAAGPVHTAVLHDEAVVLRPNNSFHLEVLRSRQRAVKKAILVAYDIMEANGQDVRPEPLEQRKKRLASLLSRRNKALRDGIQLSHYRGGGAIFRPACGLGLEGMKRSGSRYFSGRTRAWLKTKNPAAAYCRFGHDPP